MTNIIKYEIIRFPQAALTILVTAVLVTLLFWMILPAKAKINQSVDYTGIYEPVARNILEGRGVTLADRPATRTPPGYPLFLAIVFGLSDLLKLPEEAVHSAFILLCAGFSGLLLFITAQRVWGVMPALLSSVMWVAYPLGLWLTKQPQSEVPFMVVFYAAFNLFFYAILRDSRAELFYFVSGLLMGVAMLIRPIAIGIGGVLCAIILCVTPKATGRMRFAYVAMILLGNLAAVLPWQVWVYSKTGTIISLSTAGPSSMLDGLTFAVNLQGFRKPGGVPNDVKDLMVDISNLKEPVDSLGGILMVVYDQIEKRPLATLKLVALKVVRSWYGTDSRQFEFEIMLLQLPYLVLLLLGTRQAWRQGGIPKRLAISVWFIVFYFWAMTITVVSLVRYMVPAIGLLFLLIPGSLPGVRARET